MFRGESPLKRNMFSGTILAGGNILISFVGYPLYLKYLGVEIYGLWAVLSFIVAFSALGSVGIDSAIIKYVAEEYGSSNKAGIKKYFSTAIITLLISGGIIFFALFFLRRPIIAVLNISEEYIHLTNTLLPCVVILSILIYFVQVINGTLRGLTRVDLANYYFLGSRAISVITAVALFELGFGIWGLFWGQLFSYVLLGFLAFSTVYRRLGSSFFSISSFDWKYLKKMAGFGGTMTASRLISMLLVPFNKIVIAKYIGLSEVTYFEIANKVVMQIRSLFVIGTRAIMPEISKTSAIGKNSPNKIGCIFKKGMKLVSYVGVPTFILLFFSVPFLLSLWLSNAYVPMIGNAFRIILVGFLINLLSVPIYYLFMGIGKVSYCFINHFAQSILNVVIISIFIVFGITNFYLFSGIYSLSVALSALLLIILFFRYRRMALGRDYEKFTSSVLSKAFLTLHKIFSDR